jgi:ATP-dependent DNA helicase RecQ
LNNKKYEILEQYFGYKSFRPLQEEIIDAILASKDALMILPTGGGKSLCYQLPSLIMGGVTIVVSPLLALMHDQVTALRANGISSAMLSSMQDKEEIYRIEDEVLNGSIKILYISPERLLGQYTISFLHRLNINFFVIDEAHCVSVWGHEFRESYRGLSILKDEFPSTPISAFTATATLSVEDDISTNLKLNQPIRVRGTIFRKNLTINIENRIDDGKEQLLEFLKSHKGSAGIIYTLSRKSTENIANFLQQKGIEARFYHAQMDTEDKNRVYADFVSDRVQIVVATIAFGMGIDKSNIRFVVHLSMPKTVENFYQEIGRAGRDGIEAETLLLFSTKDIIQLKRFIDDLPESPYKENSYNKIDSIIRFAKSEECRHKSIAQYFDDSIDECKDKCDNCINPKVKRINITEASRKLLSTVYRTNQRFGLHYVIDVLRGSKDKRILENGHNELSVYNIGEEFSKPQWLTVADRLLELGAFTIGEFKVYYLTNLGVEVLKGEHTIELREDRLNIKKKSKNIKVKSSGKYDEALFLQLKEIRTFISKINNIPPYMVFSDRTLIELSTFKPKTKEKMLLIHGVGEIKFERYGKDFLEYLKIMKRVDR